MTSPTAAELRQGAEARLQAQQKAEATSVAEMPVKND